MQDNQNENENVVEVSAVEILKQDASLSIITKAEIDTQIATAKAFPRSLTQFLKKAVSMATISADVAASCSYALPRGGDTLSGASVRMAEIVVSCYGNLRAGARVIKNDGFMITAQGICHDLEANSCITIEVSRKITNKKGERFSQDMQVVTGNAACAIAFRNAVYKVVPAALCNEIYEAAQECARGTLETLPARRDKAVKYFRDAGVKDQQICDALGIRNIDDIDLEKLTVLSGFKSAIVNNESTLKDIFPDPTNKDKGADASGKVNDAIKDLADKAKNKKD